MDSPVKTDLFLNGIIELASGKMPDEVLQCARRCLLDYLGCALAGRRAAGRKLAELERLIGPSMQTSALIYGMAAHFIELDDGHRYGMLHPGAPVISALFAASQHNAIDAEGFLKCIVAGYEATIRLARAVQPACKLKGLHATGTCGTVGAAMAVALMLKMDPTQMKGALSAAATSAAGLLEVIEGDTELKPYNIGRAAMDGLVAAYVGRAGFKFPADALGGKRGFFAIMSGSPAPEIAAGPGGGYAITTIYRKPYAACRHCHAPIEAALAIAEERRVSPDQVKCIKVKTYRLAVAGHDHSTVDGVNSAKMSIPYSVAVALLKRTGGIEAFDEGAICDKTVLELAKKVSVTDDEELTALCPARRIAQVDVEFKDGASCSKRVDYPKGEPENPITAHELEMKFRSLAMFGGLSDSQASAIVDEVKKPEFDVRWLAAHLAKEG